MEHIQIVEQSSTKIAGNPTDRVCVFHSRLPSFSFIHSALFFALRERERASLVIPITYHLVDEL